MAERKGVRWVSYGRAGAVFSHHVLPRTRVRATSDLLARIAPRFRERFKKISTAQNNCQDSRLIHAPLLNISSGRKQIGKNTWIEKSFLPTGLFDRFGEGDIWGVHQPRKLGARGSGTGRARPGTKPHARGRNRFPIIRRYFRYSPVS